MGISKQVIFLTILLSFLGFLGSFLWKENAYLISSMTLLGVAMLPFFIRFETKKTTGKEIALIAMLVAISIVGRLIFAPLPNIQPTSFVVMMTGMMLGSEIGFIVGAVSALVSNLFLGQGPWTPWQMFAWGGMGLTAGVLHNQWILKNNGGRVLFGFIWGFFFGWIMNVWVVVGFISPITWKSFMGVMINSFYFDLMHALTNVFLMGVFSTGWIRIFLRIKTKYGLMKN
jgi:energy-coupling factor transport system substrate-specific component